MCSADSSVLEGGRRGGDGGRDNNDSFISAADRQEIECGIDTNSAERIYLVSFHYAM